MLNLTGTSHLIRMITGSAADIECHASWVDYDGTDVTPGTSNSGNITTATTTTVVASPGSGVSRNIKALYITNVSASASTRVAVEHYDGTNYSELIGFILLPGENMTFNEEGRWNHRDQNGAEYPGVGLGAYTGRAVPFMKTGTASDAAGYWYCTSKDGGFPGAWSVGSSGLSGRATDGTTSADNGSIPIQNPSIGGNYLTEIQMVSSTNHSHLFFDCLWVNNGLVMTTTTAQTINSVTLPARDYSGTTNGEGCQIALLFTTAATNAAVISNSIVTYTNSDGVGSRTASLSAIIGSQIPATPVIGTIVWFNLEAGDKGVQSIQSITLNTSLGGGAASLMICRDIATVGTTLINVSAQKIIGEPGIRLYNGTTMLHCNLSSATTATFYSGELTVMEK